MMIDFQKEPFIDLAGERIRCRRYQAMSTRRGEQCKKAALKANRDRAAQALKAERNRQRMTRAQRQLAKAQQANRSFTKPISV